jgi:hypothetical protein
VQVLEFGQLFGGKDLGHDIDIDDNDNIFLWPNYKYNWHRY